MEQQILIIFDGVLVLTLDRTALYFFLRESQNTLKNVSFEQLIFQIFTKTTTKKQATSNWLVFQHYSSM